jgi:hypothetical protein
MTDHGYTANKCWDNRQAKTMREGGGCGGWKIWEDGWKLSK